MRSWPLAQRMDWHRQQQQHPSPIPPSQVQPSPLPPHHPQHQQQQQSQQQQQYSNQPMYHYHPDSDVPQSPPQQHPQQQQQQYRPSLQPRSHSTSYLQQSSSAALMASGESHSHSHSHSHSLSLSHSLSPNAHASSSSSCNTTPSSSYTPTPTNQLSDARSSEYDGPRAARDRPELCDSVWIHSEHRKLSTRYTKAFEDLATSRSDVIRLTAELASAQARISSLSSSFPSAPPSPVLAQANVFAPPLPAPTSAAPSPVSVSTPISPNDLFAAMKASFAARPSPASGTNSNSNRPPSRRESALPSPTEYSASQSPLPLSASQGPGSGRSKYYNAPTLPSRPPDPRVVNQYLVKLGSWTRPRYDYTQLIHVHNYGNNAAVKSNLRTEMVDLDGACPTPAEWKLWIADRLTIVRDLLYPGKSWKNQRNQDKRLAVQVVEKRFPALALCEPDRCWKAAIFLQRRLDEAIKMGHESERRKGANSVNNTLGMSIGPLPVCQGLTW